MMKKTKKDKKSVNATAALAARHCHCFGATPVASLPVSVAAPATETKAAAASASGYCFDPTPVASLSVPVAAPATPMATFGSGSVTSVLNRWIGSSSVRIGCKF
jgi:hypothetical protein